MAPRATSRRNASSAGEGWAFDGIGTSGGQMPAPLHEVLVDALAHVVTQAQQRGGDLYVDEAADELLRRLRVAGYVTGERTIEPRATWSSREVGHASGAGDGFDSDGWRIMHRLVAQQGRPVCAEIRIIPSPGPNAPPGRPWSQDPSDVPSGGVPAGAIRQLRATSWAQASADDLEQIGAREIVDAVFPAGAVRRTETTVKRARVAVAYSLVDEIVGRRHAEHVGAALGYSAKRATDIKLEAVRSGLLTRPPGQGRGGGRVTSSAIELLDENVVQQVRDDVLRVLRSAERAAVRDWEARGRTSAASKTPRRRSAAQPGPADFPVSPFVANSPAAEHQPTARTTRRGTR